MKILVIRLDGFAEVLLATPLLRCLHRQRPLAEIHLLTERRYTVLLKNNPNTHYVHVWDENSSNALNGEDFNTVIDLQNDSRSHRLTKALKAQVLRAPKPSVFAFVSARLGVKRYHKVEDYFKSVASAGIYNDGEGLDFFISEADRVPVTDIPHSHHAGFLCIAIGASRPTKKIHIEMLKEICRKIDHPVILIGGNSDAAAGEAMVTVDPIKIYNACGKFTLQESADLVQRSKVLVTINTEWMQLGAALRKEMVVLQTQGNRDDSTPVYDTGFLQRNPTPFDVVHEKTSGWSFAKSGFGEVTILEKINRRVRK